MLEPLMASGMTGSVFLSPNLTGKEGHLEAGLPKNRISLVRT
jgi:hypothetical protein